MDVNLAGIIHDSIVDGPGIRSVIFFQGCPHKCFNCHNPQTHSSEINQLTSIDAVVDKINKNCDFQKVTISGGEPFLQYEALLELVNKLKDYHLWIYSGYTYQQLVDMNYTEVFEYIDALVDGLYLDDKRSLDSPYKGSTNQKIIYFNK